MLEGRGRLPSRLALVRQTLEANPRVIREMEPVIGVSKLADSSIKLCIRPWVKIPDYVPAGGEINQAVVTRLREAGIRIPPPQQEVRVINTAA